MANKELTGCGTWKSAETQENKELVFVNETTLNCKWNARMTGDHPPLYA
jgi:hypothetical protein